MHEADFELLETLPLPNGGTAYHIRIKALDCVREYHYDPATDSYRIEGEERTIKVQGYDMTSIIGKRVREWLSGRSPG